MHLTFVTAWDANSGFDAGAKCVVSAIRRLYGREVDIVGFMDQRDDRSVKAWMEERGVEIHYTRGVDPLRGKTYAINYCLEYKAAEAVVFIDADMLLLGRLDGLMSELEHCDMIAFEDVGGITHQQYRAATGR